MLPLYKRRISSVRTAVSAHVAHLATSPEHLPEEHKTKQAADTFPRSVRCSPRRLQVPACSGPARAERWPGGTRSPSRAGINGLGCTLPPGLPPGALHRRRRAKSASFCLFALPSTLPPSTELTWSVTGRKGGGAREAKHISPRNRGRGNKRAARRVQNKPRSPKPPATDAQGLWPRGSVPPLSRGLQRTQ